jgi:hypothetical protein
MKYKIGAKPFAASQTYSSVCKQRNIKQLQSSLIPAVDYLLVVVNIPISFSRSNIRPQIDFPDKLLVAFQSLFTQIMKQDLVIGQYQFLFKFVIHNHPTILHYIT